MRNVNHGFCLNRYGPVEPAESFTADSELSAVECDRCRACRAGHPDDQGVELVHIKTSDDRMYTLCAAWCSNHRYCGTGEFYKTFGSSDCRASQQICTLEPVPEANQLPFNLNADDGSQPAANKLSATEEHTSWLLQAQQQGREEQQDLDQSSELSQGECDKCRACKAGDPSDGGKVLEDGICLAYCSFHGYCGAGANYGIETAFNCFVCRRGASHNDRVIEKERWQKAVADDPGNPQLPGGALTLDHQSDTFISMRSNDVCTGLMLSQEVLGNGATSHCTGTARTSYFSSSLLPARPSTQRTSSMSSAVRTAPLFFSHVTQLGHLTVPELYHQLAI